MSAMPLVLTAIMCAAPNRMVYGRGVCRLIHRLKQEHAAELARALAQGGGAVGTSGGVMVDATGHGVGGSHSGGGGEAGRLSTATDEPPAREPSSAAPRGAGITSRSPVATTHPRHWDMDSVADGSQPDGDVPHSPGVTGATMEDLSPPPSPVVAQTRVRHATAAVATAAAPPPPPAVRPRHTGTEVGPSTAAASLSSFFQKLAPPPMAAATGVNTRQMQQPRALSGVPAPAPAPAPALAARDFVGESSSFSTVDVAQDDDVQVAGGGNGVLSTTRATAAQTAVGGPATSSVAGPTAQQQLDMYLSMR